MKHIKQIFNYIVGLNLYSGCFDMPMYNFIKCINGDLRGAKKFTLLFYNEALTKKLFNKIYVEYIDLIQDSQKTFKIALIKSVTFLETKQILFYTLAEFSTRNEIIPLIETYKKLGFFIDPNNVEKSIKLAHSKFKTDLLKLQQQRKDLENLLKEEDKNKNNSANPASIYTELSKFQQYRIDPRKTTVEEFVSISNQYKEYYSKLKANG